MPRLMLVTLLSLMVLSCRVMADDGPAGPKFSKVIYPDAVRFVSDTSPDGQARTILFDNFVLETDIGRATEPDVRVKTLTYVMGIASDSDACVHQVFQGFLARSGTASASLMIHAGGKTTAVDLQQAIGDAHQNVVKRDNPVRKRAEAAAASEGFHNSKPEGDFDSFYAQVSSVVPKGQPLQTTIILLVDRVKGGDDPNPSALLTIDAIDCTVEPAKKPGK